MGATLLSFNRFQSQAIQDIPPRPAPLAWGVFPGGEIKDFINLQKHLNSSPDFIPLFIHWGNESHFPSSQLSSYPEIKKQTLVIYWEAMDYNHPHPASDSRFSYDAILAGKWNKYLDEFAQSVKDYDAPVIIIPFEEMNGEWYPWSVTQNHNTPQKHVAAFRYLRQFFADVPKAKFAWVVNNDNVPDISQNQPLTYFPGDKYVDYVGINGFNFDNPWQTPAEIFAPRLADLKTLDKPIYIFSTASAPGPKKADWIKQLAEFINRNSRIRGWIWFNENKERDWRFWSDPDSEKAFNDFLIP